MSKGPDAQTTTTTRETQIPDFLRPFVVGSTNRAQNAMGGLERQLAGASGEDLVAGFTPQQQQGRQLAESLATGEAFDTATSAVQDIAGGQFIADNIGTVTDTLSGVAGGQSGGQGQGFVQQSGDVLSQFSNQPFQLDPTAEQALQQSAGGEFLFGSPGFNEAVDASIRQARPQILSSFAGQGGSGAARGGLAQAAIQQSASDAFANLFNQERNRQNQAAGQLGQFGLQGRQQQIGAAQGLGDLGISQQRVDLSEQAQRANAAQSLGGLLSGERGRQLQAAQALPGVAMSGPQALMDLGQQEQQLRQQQIQAPISAQQQLLNASLQGLPVQSLLGQNQTSSQPLESNTAGGILGGALAGAELGSAVPGLGTGIGAIGGGLLGGLF